MSEPAERRALLLVVLTADAERLRGALVLAAAEAAVGGSVRLFLQLDAVTLLAPAGTAPRDAAHAAGGLPTLAALIHDALALGVVLIACQSGLALAGIDAGALDPRVEIGGPVGVLMRLEAADRLVVV